jgi:tripartite-type tricarboxylate transporter receptor subunit TctC
VQIRIACLCLGQFCIMIVAAGPVASQNAYPSKPVRVVVNGPGGGSDTPARLIAPALGNALGQQVVVENRGGVISAETVARATPDGYTLLVAGNGFWFRPLLEKTSFQPTHDFAPVTLLNQAPNVIVVHPSVAIRTVGELIAFAHAKPGVLNYASGNPGSSAHLAPELFNVMAKVNIVRIPFNSGGAALNSVIAGQIEVMFPNVGGMAPHISSGRLRALAVTSLQPSPLLPDLPTVAASGVPGYESVSYIALFAPAKTPESVIRRINRAMVDVLARPDLRQKSVNTGAEAISSSPEQLAMVVKSEMTRMSRLIKQAGIKLEE